MAAYLYTWHPARWRWYDLPEAAYRVTNGEPYDMYWSCGNTRRIKRGDLFFLMRLGVDPKGILGCGYVASAPYPLPHWDDKRAAAGETTLRTDLLFKVLETEPVVPLRHLAGAYPGYNWTPQGSGKSIPDEIAAALLAEIQRQTAGPFQAESDASLRTYAEGRPRSVTITTYDRSQEARYACLERHGCRCAVCGFVFEEVYGALGAGYIEVHHLRPVADVGEEYEIDAVKDLRPVCANCHRMLHKRRPPLAIEELQQLLRRRR